MKQPYLSLSSLFVPHTSSIFDAGTSPLKTPSPEAAVSEPAARRSSSAFPRRFADVSPTPAPVCNSRLDVCGHKNSGLLVTDLNKMSSRGFFFFFKSHFSAISLKPLSHEDYTPRCILAGPSVTMATCWDLNHCLLIIKLYQCITLFIQRLGIRIVPSGFTESHSLILNK